MRDVGLVLVMLLGTFQQELAVHRAAPLVSLVYFALLAYGILRGQLFDIDLKIKLGIAKSTVVTIGLVSVLAAAKVAEFYLNRTFGWIAGGVAAAIMLVAPRLNKIGDRVASVALPKATGSAEYVADRKIEVYRAAVETAWEDGNLSQGDRAILDRLREKLETRRRDVSSPPGSPSALRSPRGAPEWRED